MAVSQPLSRRRWRIVAWLCDAVMGGVVFGLPAFVVASGSGAGALTTAAVVVAFVALLLGALFDGGRRGATPGKRLVGIRVVDARTGASIGFRRGLARRLAYAVGALALMTGWAWALLDRRRQALHDKLARTLVVVDGAHDDRPRRPI